MKSMLLGILILAASLFAVSPAPAVAQETPGQLGLGVYLGVPFGVSLKYLMDKTYAIDFAMGAQGSNFDSHTDLLVHLRDLLPQPKKGKLPVYIGMGIKLEDQAQTLFGFRFLGGVEYLTEKYPIGLFAEIAPVLRLAPSTGSNLDGGAGLRYYFGAPTAASPKK